jgi:hypothetical protein
MKRTRTVTKKEPTILRLLRKRLEEGLDSITEMDIEDASPAGLMQFLEFEGVTFRVTMHCMDLVQLGKECIDKS